MKSFYKCSLFEQPKIESLNEFVVRQQELLLKEFRNNQSAVFKKMNIEYICKAELAHIDIKKPTIIIPIRDNLELLRMTLKNLEDNSVYDICNVFVVDDRSEENLKSIIDGKTSYLRIDCNKGFNFSMLNNIAAKICADKGCSEIIFWNSDLWTPNKEMLPKILNKHRQFLSKISGAKLVYPPKQMSLRGEEDTENVKTLTKELLKGKWRETIQFGGDIWIPTGGAIRISPNHYKRFSNPNSLFVNCDKGVSFVTGAFHIWDVNYFISLGGFNPSLAKNFQDVDICLRSLENGEIPLYVGRDVFLYHDESATFYNLPTEKKFDNQLLSDHCLFGKLWNNKIVELVMQ